jgi:glycosyltransferase involved in cell wall biosynthesis
MQTPLVSIIIPTYNRTHLIGETLGLLIFKYIFIIFLIII